MNPMDAFVAELDQESVATRRMLEHAPEGKFDWKPHEKGMAMGELCGHIAALIQNMPEVLGGDSFDFSDRPAPEPPPTTRAEALDRFDTAVAGCREWLSGLGDRAHTTWRMTLGEKEMMAMPRIAAIRSFLFNHHYHHRGQLSTYLRATGEVVPSVYGRTADVNPFEA